MLNIIEILVSTSILVDFAMDYSSDLSSLMTEGILPYESKLHVTTMCIKIAFLVGMSYYTGTQIL